MTNTQAIHTLSSIVRNNCLNQCIIVGKIVTLLANHNTQRKHVSLTRITVQATTYLLSKLKAMIIQCVKCQFVITKLKSPKWRQITRNAPSGIAHASNFITVQRLFTVLLQYQNANWRIQNQRYVCICMVLFKARLARFYRTKLTRKIPRLTGHTFDIQSWVSTINQNIYYVIVCLHTTL